MIAARLAGGNLFFGFFGVGDFFGWGILGALGAARSTLMALLELLLTSDF